MLLNYHSDSSIDELFKLESLIRFTKEACLSKEINANYYDLDGLNKLKLSEERNDYINSLSIIEEKIYLLKERYINNEKIIIKHQQLPQINNSLVYHK